MIMLTDGYCKVRRRPFEILEGGGGSNLFSLNTFHGCEMENPVIVNPTILKIR